MELDDDHEAFFRAQQTSRAEKHQGPLRELKQKMRKEATKSSLPTEDINVILSKLEEEPENLPVRPKRTAAVKAAVIRQQMIKDNIL